MNREEIDALWRECCIPEGGTDELVYDFAQRIAAAEREKCAKVCDLVAREIDDTNGTATYCAKAIRTRGEK